MTKHVLCYLFIVSLIKVGTIMAGHRHIPTTPVPWNVRPTISYVPSADSSSRAEKKMRCYRPIYFLRFPRYKLQNLSPDFCESRDPRGPRGHPWEHGGQSLYKTHNARPQYIIYANYTEVRIGAAVLLCRNRQRQTEVFIAIAAYRPRRVDRLVRSDSWIDSE